jgi:xanthine dehydrogenase YagS FAD-binding subunit
MNGFEWAEPRTVDEALALLDAGAVAKAGGVDLLDLMKEGLAAPKRLVSLRRLPGLDRLEGDVTRGLAIGPLVTLAQLDASPLVRATWGALADAAGRAATPQIRNQATVGGNLLQRPRCWYFRAADLACVKKGGPRCLAQAGDHRFHAIFENGRCAAVHPSALAVPLVALGARLEVTSKDGRRELPLEEVFVRADVDPTREHALGPDELITAVRLPAAPGGLRSAYLKQGEKDSYDWPLVDVAVALELEGGRCARASVVLGHVAHVPWRARAAEEALAGKTLDEALAATAAAAAVRGATPLPGNGYKTRLVEVVVRRALLAAAGGAK